MFTFMGFRFVPKDCFMVVGANVHGPGKMYFRWPSETAEEQLWKITSETENIPTQIGELTIGWTPKAENFLDFVNRGGDAAIRAKLESILKNKAEQIVRQYVVPKNDESGVCEPSGLLLKIADEYGVKLNHIHIPTLKRHPDIREAGQDDVITIRKTNAEKLVEIEKEWTKYWEEHGAYIDSVDAKRIEDWTARANKVAQIKFGVNYHDLSQPDDKWKRGQVEDAVGKLELLRDKARQEFESAKADVLITDKPKYGPTDEIP